MTPDVLFGGEDENEIRRAMEQQRDAEAAIKLLPAYQAALKKRSSLKPKTPMPKQAVKTPAQRQFLSGWVPDLPDHRDLQALAVARPQRLEGLPPAADLRNSGFMPCVYDQGNLNSCVGNAVAGAVAYDMAKQGRKVFTAPPSRLFLYYNARKLEGWEDSDSGAMIRDAFKSLNQVGCCSEKDWAYVEQRVCWPPTPPCYKDGLGEQSVTYGRVRNYEREMMQILLSNGYPIVGGISVYESFVTEEVRRTGVVPMPGAHESLLGGHAIVVVGYNDDVERYFVRNSWGADWGDQGYLYIPYAYIESISLADDFWIVTQME